MPARGRLTWHQRFLPGSRPSTVSGRVARRRRAGRRACIRGVVHPAPPACSGSVRRTKVTGARPLTGPVRAAAQPVSPGGCSAASWLRVSGFASAGSRQLASRQLASRQLASAPAARAGFASAGLRPAGWPPASTSSATARIVIRRSIEVFWIQRNASASVMPRSPEVFLWPGRVVSAPPAARARSPPRLRAPKSAGSG